MKNRLFVGCFLFLACLGVYGQSGDRKGHDMVENWKTMNIPPAPPLTPEEALKTIKVAPGFKVELVAAEPMLVNPVAMSWDGDGRMWVVEMVAYMPNVDGKGEDVKTGRITVLEDTNGDGKMDKRTVYLDGLVMPRALSLVQGGVLVAEPPNLWYCQDLDGDLKCDKKTKVTSYAKQGPVEHTDNGLMPALDNWIYSAKSKRRFQFKDGKLTEGNTTFRGQWGITQDNYGRLYYTNNSRYLLADWNTYGQKISLKLGDTSINSSRPNSGINRGYMKGMLGKDNRLAKVTAISGPGAYRGDLYGDEYLNGMFIPEPSANAIAYFAYSENGASPNFKHKTYPDKKWGKLEFVTSTDERFRPVSIYTGPDGCIYFIDLNHGILQHRVYVTTYLRKQIVERGLDKNNDTGRIYRIVPEGKKIGAGPKMLKQSSADLVTHLSHPNGWWRDTAQRLLVQRGDQSVAPALRSLLAGDNHLAKIHALWTLRGIGSLTSSDIAAAAADAHPKVKLTSNVILKGSAEAKKVVVKSNYKKLNKAGQALYKAGEGVYGMSCFGCHQPNGKGLDKISPPLTNSEWVDGSTERLIMIALHGVSGDIKVGGKMYKGYPVMPGHGPAFDDKKIASVLTYVRNTWGNKGAVVTAKEVAAVRAKTKERTLPWTAKELQAVE